MASHIDLTRGARAPHLRLLLADGCNLSCSYCHFHATHATQDQAAAADGQRVPRRVMSPETAAGAVRVFAAAMRARGEAHVDLSLYGGEPLVNPAGLEAALAAAEAARGEDLSVTPIVNTNGTLVDAAVAARFAQAGARAHVSLDGVDLAGNTRRRLHSGAASLSAALRGLSALQRAGVPMQLNVVLTDSNLGQLAALMPLAREAGCDQVFFAMPDEAGGCGPGRPDTTLPALLDARAVAHRLGLRVIGPWSVGQRAPQAATDLAWNLVVRSDGRWFIPQCPQRLFGSLEALTAPTVWAALAADWQQVRAGCLGCSLDASCRGYLKMMTRYHAGPEADAQSECELARKAAEMLNDPRHQMLRTALLAQAGPPATDADGDLPLVHPRLAGPLEVSDGVLDLLDFFLPGATPQSAADHFDAEDLGEHLAVLRAHGLLQPVDDGDDRARLEALLRPHGEIQAYAGLLVGAAEPALLHDAAALRPLLEQAVARLPKRLQPVVDRCCVFVAADEAAFARAAGLPADAPWLSWMAGTVAEGVLVLNHSACAAVLAQGGRARLGAFVQQLAHELVHLMLRQRGVRLPVWLEEGLCEALSNAPLGEARLREALPHAEAFVGFVRACMAAHAAGSAWTPETALLRFSSAPVDENPGYVMAHDLVQQLIAELGVDGLLDALAARGLRGRHAPFPLREGAAGWAGLSLEALLTRWRDGLAERLPAQPQFEQPMRVVALGRQALVYNRIVGGHAWVTAPDASTAAHWAALADHNLPLDAVAAMLDGHPDRGPLLAQWQANQLARQRGYHLRLTLEGGCNMSCSYCYEGQKKRQAMSIATANQAVAAWRDLLEPGDLPGSSVRMFGGEPFMNWPVMKHVFETAAIGLPPGSVQWYLNTNGTLVRDEHIDFLKEVGPNLLVHLSLDGVATVNDRDRVFNNGRGTFEHVDRAARRFVAAAIPLNIAVTLTPHNAHGLPELLRYVAELQVLNPGAPLNVSIKPVIGPDLCDDDAQVMLAALEAGLAQGALLGLDVGGEPLRAANLLFQDATPTGHFCGVGGRELYVTPDGGLMVCHAMPGSEYSNLAEVARSHHIPVPAEVAARHAGAVDGCSGCEVEGLCGGGCMAQSKMATGSIARKPSDYFCLLMRASFRGAVQRGLQARAGA